MGPMAESPLVSVVMAVHNGERYLDEAVQSILDQEFGDFEFLINPRWFHRSHRGAPGGAPPPRWPDPGADARAERARGIAQPGL